MKDDRTLAQRLLDFVRDLLEKFRNALKGYKAKSLEARTLSRNIELLTSFEDTFTEVLQEYGERNKAEGKTGEVVDKRGQQSEEKTQTGMRYSLMELPDGETYVKLDGNLYDDGNGGRLTDAQAYDKIVNTIGYIVLDGKNVSFIKSLQDKRQKVYKIIFAS